MRFLLKRICKIILVIIFLAYSVHFTQKIYAAYYNEDPKTILGDLDKIDQSEKENKGILINDVGIGFRSPDVMALAWASKMIPLRECKDPTKNDCKTAVGYLVRLMDSMYDQPPASFAWYMGDFLANAGFPIKQTYAQGIGFNGLKPLLFLWRTTRNIAYAILAVVMVAIGFMIIFRRKIDPKTVISVQAALPKIIVTLLFITFSYALAGFLIDLMYVAIAIIVSILSNSINGEVILGADFIKQTAVQQQEFMTGGWGKLLTSVISGGMIPSLFYQFFFGSMFNAILGVGGTVGLIGIPLLFDSFPISAPIMALLTPVPLLLFIIGLGLLFTFIRLTLLLVNSYIQIIIAVILGPLLILPEAIPGKSAFSGWVLNLIANLSVFPATVLLIYASWIVTSVAMKGTLWGAPLIPTGGGSEAGGGNPLAIIIGLGIIFLAPNLVVSIKKIFQPKPTLPITAGTMLSPLTGAVGTGMGAASQFYYMQQVMNTGAFAGILKTLTGKGKKE